MREGDIVEFRATLNSERIITGKLIHRMSIENWKGERPWWTVDIGKKVKKEITIHQSQIVGLVRSG
jgi:hypothetical protein